MGMADSTTMTLRLVGYFPAGANAQDYAVADVPAERLTHLIYAFAGVSADGECISLSPAQDRANFPELLTLKKQFPRLKTLISVGGASNALHFPTAVSTPAGRVKLAQSCVQFMKTNGFDGIDVDWEFPGAADKDNFSALLVELRSALTAEGRYLLTIAAPAGQSHYENIDLAAIHPHLDWINLMTYNFAVTTSQLTNFVAPLYEAKDDPTATRASHNVDAAVKAYLAANVPADKVVVGVRFVGTGWQGVTHVGNGLYQRNGGAAPGTWDKPGSAPSGSLTYQDIEENYLGRYTEFWKNDAQVPWLYNAATGIMISYEDEESTGLKADYVLTNGLGGIMVWQLAADDHGHSLINRISGKFLAKAATAVV